MAGLRSFIAWWMGGAGTLAGTGVLRFLRIAARRVTVDVSARRCAVSCVARRSQIQIPAYRVYGND